MALENDKPQGRRVRVGYIHDTKLVGNQEPKA